MAETYMERKGSLHEVSYEKIHISEAWLTTAKILIGMKAQYICLLVQGTCTAKEPQRLYINREFNSFGALG